MFKKIILVVVAIIILGGAGYFIYQSKIETETPKEIEKFSLDPKNCTYIIEGKNIMLKDGYSEGETASGSASKTTTRYFGNEVSGDFNGDGLSDIAFILLQDLGGSGTFYYIVAAIGDTKECKGTNAIFLGDRISPQTTEIQEGKIIVNYVDRKKDEAMVVPPSIGITKQFTLEGMNLKDITSEEATKEQACALSGGTIKASFCCSSVSDFPNLCLIGACGCSPINSKSVKICDCGEGKCFNGSECSAI